nr:hypothetical protein [uncultured Pedobacter sp.]
MILAKYGKNLEKDFIIEDLKNLVAQLADTTLSSFSEDLISIVPGGSFINGVIKISKNLRDIHLIEKVTAFFKEIENKNSIERSVALEKFKNESNLGEDFGKYILLTLDRVESNLKASYIGLITGYYIEGKIHTLAYERLIYIIQQLYINDIISLLQEDYLGFGREYTARVQGLISHSIIKATTEIKKNTGSSLYYSEEHSLNTKGFKITPVGGLLIAILKKEIIPGYWSVKESCIRFL